MRVLLVVVVVFLLFGCKGVLYASVIHDAARKGDFAKVKTLLKQDPELLYDVNQEDETPLHTAVRYAKKNCFEIVSYLIEQGADLEAIDCEGRTPLRLAAWGKDRKVFDLLLSKMGGKCDIWSAILLEDAAVLNKVLDENPKLSYTAGPDSIYPIEFAVECKSPEMVAILIDRGAKETVDLSDMLSSAIRYGSPAVAKVLLEKGANPNPERKNLENLLGDTMFPPQKDIAKLLLAKGAKVSIHYAAYSNDLATVRKMLDENPRLLKSEDYHGNAVLDIAAAVDAIDVAKLLVERGADPNDGYPQKTAIQRAAIEGSKNVASFLISKGAKINVPNLIDSPLCFAVRLNHQQVAELLVSKGAKVNAKDEFSSIPLHYATTLAMAKLLISHKSEIDAVDCDGNTPLAMAAKRGSKEIVGLLIAKGAKINIKDKVGATPLGWAVRNNHKEVVDLLIKHKAKKIMPPKDALDGLDGRCVPMQMHFSDDDVY